MRVHSATSRTDPIRRRFLAAGLGLPAIFRSFGNAAEAGSTATAGGIHHRASADAVIQLFMNGGPSHLDLFDPKPELQARDGEPLPGGTKPRVFFGAPGPLLASPFRFRRVGESGQWVSELLPHTARVVDELTIIRSMTCDSNNHAPALFQMNTGRLRTGDPSLGAWAVFGAGAIEADLPGFVVLCDPAGGPIGGAANWGAGYLPGKNAGKPLRSRGASILHLDSRFSDDRRGSMRAILDAIDREHLADHPGEPELEARIESRDLAERMRAEAPEAVDLDRETAANKRLYGLDDPIVAPYGRRLLIARRLVERGVRFVQVYSGGGAFEDNWDAHYDLKTNHTRRTRETDQAVAALILDLRARGLLERTLVLWGGEFGRMPISQARIGRDHNPHGFTCWMAGGGAARARSVGRTDDFGLHAIERPVHVNDWHATILHVLGIDHLRLTVRHEGRDKRLTDVAGTVVAEALARPTSLPTDH